MSDIEVYQNLLPKIDSILYWPTFYHKLKALQHQKQILCSQAHQLLGKKNIENCMEIGSPCTYISAFKNITIRGKRYYLNDQENLSDHAQSFSFNPSNSFLSYDTFIPLNDYSPIKPTDITDQSLDLIVCFIGLHHIPVEKLDSFVASLARTLRPGGTLLLRDHDCKTPELLALTSTAHTIFNAIVTKETVQQEAQEYRNFQPLSFWITALEKHGFTTDNQRLLQNGDPTRNTMIAFTKIAQTQQEEIATISHELKTSTSNTYYRDVLPTYLSASEWYNVDAAQEYAAFVHHTPFYQFPFLQNIKNFWSIFAKSWQVAAARKGHFATLYSDSTLFNLFVGIMMTIEYGVKSIISWPLQKMYEGQTAPSFIQALVRDPQNALKNIKDITILKTYPTANIILIQMPRYKKFLHVLLEMQKAPIKFIEIAGQKEIQIKIKYPTKQPIHYDMQKGYLDHYEWVVPTDHTHTYESVVIEVDKLTDSLADLTLQGAEIIFAYDY